MEEEEAIDGIDEVVVAVAIDGAVAAAERSVAGAAMDGAAAVDDPKMAAADESSDSPGPMGLEAAMAEDGNGGGRSGAPESRLWLRRRPLDLKNINGR